MSLSNRMDSNQSRDGGDPSVSNGASRYEPPTVKRVGDLHELLAGGTGSTLETQDPFAKKNPGDPG